MTSIAVGESFFGSAALFAVKLLLQMASALILPFVLFGALAKGYPSYMDTVAENAA